MPDVVFLDYDGTYQYYRFVSQDKWREAAGLHLERRGHSGRGFTAIRDKSRMVIPGTSEQRGYED